MSILQWAVCVWKTHTVPLATELYKTNNRWSFDVVVDNLKRRTRTPNVGPTLLECSMPMLSPPVFNDAHSKTTALEMCLSRPHVESIPQVCFGDPQKLASSLVPYAYKTWLV